MLLFSFVAGVLTGSALTIWFFVARAREREFAVAREEYARTNGL